MVKGLTHFHIVERRLIVVQADVEDTHTLNAIQFFVERVGGISNAFDVGQADRCHIQLALLVHHHPRAARQNKIDTLQFGLGLAIVVLVAFQGNKLAEAKFSQLKGPGAVGLVSPSASATLDVLLIEHVGGGVS